jgi:hypothetical protein
MTERERESLAADLSAYVDGELSPQRAGEVEAWLRTSVEARQELDELRRVSGAVRGLPRLTTPDSLAVRIAAAAAARRAVGRPSRLKMFAWRRGPQISAAAAAVLFVCIWGGYHVAQAARKARPAHATTPAPVVAAAPERSAPIVMERDLFLDAPEADRPAAALAKKSEAVREERVVARELVDGPPPAPWDDEYTRLPTEIRVLIETESEPEYAALAEFLRPWAAPAGRWLIESAEKLGQGATGAAADVAAKRPDPELLCSVQFSRQIDTGELQQWLDEIRERVGTPAQVHVQMGPAAGRDGRNAGATSKDAVKKRRNPPPRVAAKAPAEAPAAAAVPATPPGPTAHERHVIQIIQWLMSDAVGQLDDAVWCDVGDDQMTVRVLLMSPEPAASQPAR